MAKFVPDYEITVCGIPCGVVIESFNDVPPWKGSASTCPSDVDYYGYVDIEWFLIDRKGYPAKWLERKMDKEGLRYEVEVEIIDLRKNDYEEYKKNNEYRP